MEEFICFRPCTIAAANIWAVREGRRVSSTCRLRVILSAFGCTYFAGRKSTSSEDVRRLYGGRSARQLRRATTKLAISRTTPDRIAARKTTSVKLSAVLRMSTVAEMSWSFLSVEKIIERPCEMVDSHGYGLKNPKRHCLVNGVRT